MADAVIEANQGASMEEVSVVAAETTEETAE